MTLPFDPDWCVPPGEYVRELMEDEFHLPPSALAIACGRMPVELLERVIAGEAEITQGVAEGLAMGTGVPARMWLNLEKRYREGLAAGKTVIRG